MTTITRYPPTATTPIRRNRVSNPRMSTGSLASWSASTGAGTLAYSAVVGSSLRFTTTASGVAVVENVSPAVPGEVISAAVDIQPFTTNRTGLLRLYFLDASMATLSGPFDATAAVTVGSWTTITNSNRTAPAGTAYVRLLAGINNSAGAGQAINVTKAIIQNGAGPVSSYFDGDGIGGSGGNSFPFFYYWEGQKGLSPSREVDVSFGPDQLTLVYGIGLPFEVTRESRSVVKPLLESSAVRSVLIAAGPRQGTFRITQSASIAMTWMDWFSTASLYYLQDESWSTMWFGLGGGDVRFSQTMELPTRGFLEVPFIETSAP